MPTLTDNELRALAHYAVGVTSEGKDMAYRLTFPGNHLHEKDGAVLLDPIGNSGYSVGELRADLGQRKDTIMYTIARPLRIKCYCVMLCLLVLAVCSVKAHATSPSFDCHKATTHVEKMICASRALSALDGKLQQTYKRALTAVVSVPGSVPQASREMVNNQRDWLTYQRNICLTDACLQRVYTARLKFLTRIIHDPMYSGWVKMFKVTPPGSADPDLWKFTVVILEDPSDAISSYNEMLAAFKVPERVIDCRKDVFLPIPSNSGHGQYGGICTLRKSNGRELVEICADNMVGHVKVRPIKQTDVADISARDLALFTYRYCE